MNEINRICSQGIWDLSIPNIQFDDNGVSNYAKIQLKMMNDFPLGKVGLKKWEDFVKKIKKLGDGNRYDCIVGVSGGTDSSYLLHLAKENGLRPLAVNLDNGWNSDIAVKNIKKMCSALNVDLETYVIDYEEMKDILKAYIRAVLPWIDNPTDQAIHSILYLKAIKEKVKYILVGNDFRSEGKQPSEWTYGDSKQLRYIVKRFGSTKIRTFPLLSFLHMAFLNYVKGIKVISPFNYLEYNKKDAQNFLISKYNWQYYGEHHHENIFTKWAIGHWMYFKFGIDKRIVTYSAQILNRQLTKSEALLLISKSPVELADKQRDTSYVLKKLELSQEEFNTIWETPNKSITDYPSYYNFIRKFGIIINPVVKFIFQTKPKFFYELEEKRKN